MFEIHSWLYEAVRDHKLERLLRRLKSEVTLALSSRRFVPKNHFIEHFLSEHVDITLTPCELSGDQPCKRSVRLELDFYEHNQWKVTVSYLWFDRFENVTGKLKYAPGAAGSIPESFRSQFLQRRREFCNDPWIYP